MIGNIDCACGAGDNLRISYWALLLPAALVFLGVGLFEIWTRARTEKPSEADGQDTRRSQPTE